MNTYEAICSRRTIREFLDKPVSYELLKKFVDAGRLAPQTSNRQPLEFIIVDDNKLIDDFFKNVKFAGAIDWEPELAKKPRAYILILANPKIQKSLWIPYDVALAAQNISLAAWEEGIGSCLIGAFNKNKIREFLNVPDEIETPLLIALGYPAHTSRIEEIKGDNINYWRDSNGNFHVPKRSLKKMIHHNKY